MDMRTKIIRTIGISLSLLLIGGSVAWADKKHNNPHQNQQARIKQGVRTGEITQWELNRLRKEQARIHAARRHAGADGWINHHERQHLQNMQDRAGRHIYFAKHNSRATCPNGAYKKRHAPYRQHAPAPAPNPKNDWFYFGGHIAQPGWGFGWSTGGGF